jgi:hypothetical protein
MSLRDSIDSLSDRGQTIISSMAPRERVLVAISVLVVFCTLGYFAQRAMSSSTDQLKANINRTVQAQAQVDDLLTTYGDLTGQAESLDARLEAGRKFAPLTWIESMGNSMGIQSNIRSVNERGTETTDYYVAQSIDLIINDIDLKAAVDLLYRIETAPQAVRVTDMRIKTDRKDRSQLDLRLELAFLRPGDAS